MWFYDIRKVSFIFIKCGNLLPERRVKWKSLSRVWLYDPTDNTVHGILQARILEWLAFPFSRESSQPRDQTQVYHIAGGFFTIWATRETQDSWGGRPIPSPGELPDPGIEPGSPILQADSLPTEPPDRKCSSIFWRWSTDVYIRSEMLWHIYLTQLRWGFCNIPYHTSTCL